MKTLRAAIYARFSSDLQRDRSIDDQIAVCRDYAARQGFEVVAVFSDRAVTGATRHGRAGVGRLLEAAAAGEFDLMIAETMSRVGRDEEDRAAIRKRLTFHGVTIMTPVDGVVTRLTDGIKAVMDGHYLEDLKVMIRRGMAGVIRDGRHAGGRAYAYRPVPGKKGELEVVPEQAEIVAGFSAPMSTATRSAVSPRHSMPKACRRRAKATGARQRCTATPSARPASCRTNFIAVG